MRLLVLVGLGGCGGQSGNEGSVKLRCDETGREEIALDAVPEGFVTAPQVAIDESVGAWSGWFDGDFTDGNVLLDATAAVTYTDGPVVLVSQLRYAPVETAGGWEDHWVESSICPFRQEIPLHVAFAVDGGILDEALDVTLQVAPDGSSWFEETIALDAVGGSATPSWDPADWDTIDLMLYGDPASCCVPGPDPFQIQATWHAEWWEAENSVVEAQEDLGGFNLER